MRLQLGRSGKDAGVGLAHLVMAGESQRRGMIVDGDLRRVGRQERIDVAGIVGVELGLHYVCRCRGYHVRSRES